MEPDPPTLDYQSPVTTRPRGRGTGATVGKYCLGILAGFAISLLYYAVLGTAGYDGVPLLFGAVGLKMVLGTALLAVDRWRAFALGLITSAPLALLMLLGVCFVAFNA